MQHQQQHQIAASFLEQHMNHDSDEEEKQLEDIRAIVNNTTAATMMDIAEEPLDIKPDPQLINIINRTSDSQQQQQQQHQSSENQYNNTAVSSSHDISVHHNLVNINSSAQHNSESIAEDEQDNLQESLQHHQQSQSAPEQGYQV